MSDLYRVNNWMNNTLLGLNDDKSTVMFIARSNVIESLREYCVSMNNKPLQRVCQTRILGIQIAECLSWHVHANAVATNKGRNVHSRYFFDRHEIIVKL
jgi:hypothetical protein